MGMSNLQTSKAEEHNLDNSDLVQAHRHGVHQVIITSLTVGNL